MPYEYRSSPVRQDWYKAFLRGNHAYPQFFLGINLTVGNQVFADLQNAGTGRFELWRDFKGSYLTGDQKESLAVAGNNYHRASLAWPRGKHIVTADIDNLWRTARVNNMFGIQNFMEGVQKPRVPKKDRKKFEPDEEAFFTKNEHAQDRVHLQHMYAVGVTALDSQRAKRVAARFKFILKHVPLLRGLPLRVVGTHV